jgi:hypothetical protein
MPSVTAGKVAVAKEAEIRRLTRDSLNSLPHGSPSGTSRPAVVGEVPAAVITASVYDLTLSGEWDDAIEVALDALGVADA